MPVSFGYGLFFGRCITARDDHLHDSARFGPAIKPPRPERRSACLKFIDCEETSPAVLDLRLQKRFLTTERVGLRTSQIPFAGAFVARQSGEFVLSAFGHHRDIDRCMKSGCGCHGALTGEFEKPEGTQEIENIGAFRPGNLTILRSAECFEYGFVRIRGHLVLSSCAAMTTLVTVARLSATSTKRGAPNFVCERMDPLPECLATACVRCCFLLQAPVESTLIARFTATPADAFRITR